MACAAALTAGCTTVDELRQQPVLWTAVYPVSYEVMANCLTLRVVEDAGSGLYTVTPQIYPAARRALVTGAAGPRMDTEFSVRQISVTESEVGFRRVRSAFNNESIVSKFRKIADDCGRPT